MNHSSPHETFESLPVDPRDLLELLHALRSVRDELETVDAYDHRADIAPSEVANAASEPDASEATDYPMMTMEWTLFGAAGFR